MDLDTEKLFIDMIKEIGLAWGKEPKCSMLLIYLDNKIYHELTTLQLFYIDEAFKKNNDVKYETLFGCQFFRVIDYDVPFRVFRVMEETNKQIGEKQMYKKEVFIRQPDTFGTVLDLMKHHSYVGFEAKPEGYRYFICKSGPSIGQYYRPEGCWSTNGLRSLDGRFFVFESKHDLLQWMAAEVVTDQRD
jgi:hypothetical protein